MNAYCPTPSAQDIKAFVEESGLAHAVKITEAAKLATDDVQKRWDDLDGESRQICRDLVPRIRLVLGSGTWFQHAVSVLLYRVQTPYERALADRRRALLTFAEAVEERISEEYAAGEKIWAKIKTDELATELSAARSDVAKRRSSAADPNKSIA